MDGYALAYQRITNQKPALIIGKDFVAVNYGEGRDKNGIISHHSIAISGQTRSYTTRQGHLPDQLVYFQVEGRNLYLPLPSQAINQDLYEGLAREYTSNIIGITLDELVALLTERGMHFPEERFDDIEDAPTSP